MSSTAPAQPNLDAGRAGPKVIVADAVGRRRPPIEISVDGLSVGRQGDNDLVLADPAIARQHLFIEWDGVQVLVTDLGGEAGTSLGGVRLEPFSPTIWDQALPLAIGPYTFQISPYAVAPARDLIEVALAPALLRLTPGEPTQVQITLVNHDVDPHTVTVVVEGALAPWVLPVTEPILLAPGVAVAVRLQIQPPATPDHEPSDYPVTVRALSERGVAVSGMGRGFWTVPAVAALSAAIVPERARGRRQARYIVELRNRGNASAHYLLGLSQVSGLTYALDRSEVEVAPGGVEEVALTVTASARTFGNPQPYNFLVLSKDADGRVGPSAEGVFVQTPALPIWFAVAGLLTVLLLILAGSALTFAGNTSSGNGTAGPQQGGAGQNGATGNQAASQAGGINTGIDPATVTAVLAQVAASINQTSIALTVQAGGPTPTGAPILDAPSGNSTPTSTGTTIPTTTPTVDAIGTTTARAGEINVAVLTAIASANPATAIPSQTPLPTLTPTPTAAITAITLSDNSVPEDKLEGFAVGTLSVQVINSTDTVAFTLLEGDADNNVFTIVGDELRTKAKLNFESKKVYTINVRAAISSVSTTQTFSIDITDVNEPPVAITDQLLATEDRPLTIALPSILANDRDPDSGDTLTILSVEGRMPSDTEPARISGGELTFNATGSLIFSPNKDFFTESAPLTFEYIVKDSKGLQATGTVTIQVKPVNDKPFLQDMKPVPAINEGGSLELPGWATINKGASNETTQSITTTIRSSNPNLVENSDIKLDSNGTLKITFKENTYGSSVITIVLQDTGGISDGGENTSETYSFTAVVNSVNDPPDFSFLNPPGNVTVKEDSGVYNSPWAQTISAGPNESEQDTTFTVTCVGDTEPPARECASNLFSVNPTVLPNGTLSFTPAQDRYGSAQVTVRLVDNGGTANGGINVITKTFRIDLEGVNDQPVIELKENRFTVNSNAGPQAIQFDDWIETVSPGPFETQQTLTYWIEPNVADIFEQGPAIDGAGRLTFTPKPESSGTARFTVGVQDNGESNLRSTGRNISITVNKVINPKIEFDLIVPDELPNTVPTGYININDINSAKFQIEANDPSIGANNGDGIKGVRFQISYLGVVTGTPPNPTPGEKARTEGYAPYCAFGGSDNCDEPLNWDDMAVWPNGRYQVQITITAINKNLPTVPVDFCFIKGGIPDPPPSFPDCPAPRTANSTVPNLAQSTTNQSVKMHLSPALRTSRGRALLL